MDMRDAYDGWVSGWLRAGHLGVAQTAVGSDRPRKKVRIFGEGTEMTGNKIHARLFSGAGWCFDICATNSVWLMLKQGSNHLLRPGMFRSLLQ